MEQRFALLAAAGELATYFGVTGWNPGDALAGVRQCFESWLETHDDEENQMINAVRLVLETHGQTRLEPDVRDRFSPVDEDDEDAAGDIEASRPILDLPRRGIPNRMGFRKTVRKVRGCYCIPTDLWQGEILCGFHSRAVLGALKRRNYLVFDGNRFTAKVNNNEGAYQNVYAIKPTILATGEG